MPLSLRFNVRVVFRRESVVSLFQILRIFVVVVLRIAEQSEHVLIIHVLTDHAGLILERALSELLLEISGHLHRIAFDPSGIQRSELEPLLHELQFLELRLLSVLGQLLIVGDVLDIEHVPLPELVDVLGLEPEESRQSLCFPVRPDVCPAIRIDGLLDVFSESCFCDILGARMFRVKRYLFDEQAGVSHILIFAHADECL